MNRPHLPYWIRIALLCLLAIPGPAHSAEADGEGAIDRSGRSVAVIYNATSQPSREVAEHYASRRGVPTNHLIGLQLPLSDAMPRSDFEEQLEKPLVAALVERQLLTLRDEIRPATESLPGRVIQVTRDAQIRHLVVCYGVPLRVADDPSRREPESSVFPEPLRRNEAAVDAELTVLPLLLAGHARTGPAANVYYGAPDASVLHPTNGMFVVGRIDGPTPDLARALVDRALEAEQNGLLGRGYFDIRGLTDGPYLNGDLWISNAWTAVTHYGYDTQLDTRPETLPVGYPMSHIAFYAGWYDANLNGPFLTTPVEFMPGAVAYHLHSFSAVSLRSTNQGWAGPLVARGVTATMGMVAEPYLDGTPDVGMCYARFLYSGFSWGEAALASQRLLSWQLTVIGDPLYRPFGMSLLDRARVLAGRGQGRVDWVLAMLYNRKREATGDLKGVIADLEREPRLKFSPVLQEKLASFLRAAGEDERAADAYKRAGKWLVSPQQRKRLLWNAAEAYQAAGKPGEAYDLYEELARLDGPPPNPLLLHERLESLARALGRTRDARRWTEALEALRTPTAKP